MLRNMTYSMRLVAGWCAVILLLTSVTLFANAAENVAPTETPAAVAPATKPVPVKDGIVQPREPLADQLVRAMAFLKKADGEYVPGTIDGPLAGYYSSAHVQADGSRSTRT